MSWVRIDDQFPDHPKVADAGPYAAWLYVKALAYSNRYLTDGFIPIGAVPGMVEWSFPFECNACGNGAVTIDNLQLAEHLVAAGLWHDVDGGFAIHDYLDYQPSRASVKAEKDLNRERVRRFRGKSNAPVMALQGERNASGNGPVTHVPTPTPKDQNTLTRAGAAWGQYVGLFADSQGLDDVARLCEEGARAAGIEPGDYCDRAVAAFVAWVDGIEPAARRPQKAPVAFVRNFGRIQEIVAGKRAAKPSTASAENELITGPILARGKTREVKL